MPTEKEKTDKVRLIARVFNNETDSWSKEFDQYDEGYNFLIGEHYTEKQKAYFKERRRPINVFNLILPTFNAVLGDFLLSSFREHVYARIGGDPKVAEILEKLFDHIAWNSEYRYEMGITLLAGMVKRGYAYPHYSNEKEIDGSVIIPNIDEYEVMFDSRTKDYFLDDAKYVIRSKWLCTDDILHTWTNHRSKLKKLLRDKQDSAYFYSQDETAQINMQHKNFTNDRNGQYRAIEFHERVYEPVEVAFNVNTGEADIFTLKGKKRDLYLRVHPEIQIIERVEEIIKITEVIPGLDYFLDDRDADVQDKHFDIVPFSAYNYAKRTMEFFGLTKNAIGPMKDINDSRNQELNIINKSGNEKEFWKPDRITNWNQIKEHTAEPGIQGFVDQNAEIGDVYHRVDPPKYPFAHGEYSKEGMELLNKIIGVTENLWGEVQTRNETASLFSLRVQQVQKAMAVLDNNLRRTQNRIWSRVIKLIQKHYTTERYFTIVNPKTYQTNEIGINVRIGDQIINNIQLGEYRVIASNEERNPLARTARFVKRWEIAQIVIQTLGPQAVDWRWLLEDSDLGDVEKLLERIEETINQMMNTQNKEEGFADVQRLLEGAKQKVDMEGTEVRNVGNYPE